MPKFAHVLAAVPCRGCGADLSVGGRVAFQWGYCSAPMHSNAEADAYAVGNELVWGAGPDGRVPAWVYFSDGSGNLGDPWHGDVLVRECEFGEWRCGGCGREAGGVYVLVRGGRVAAVEVREAALPPADVCVVGLDGELSPRPGWEDAPMEAVSWPVARLVLHSQAAGVA